MALYSIEEIPSFGFGEKFYNQEKETILKITKEVLSETKNNHKMAFQSRLEVETKGKVDVIIFSSRRGFLISVMCANQYYENMMEIGLNYHSPNPLSLNTNYIFIASSQPFYQS